MSTIIRVTGAPAIERRLDELAGPGLANRLRRGVRAGAKPFQAALKEVAAESDVPRSFQKVPAAKVSTHGGASGRDVVARVRPKSPLFNIFEPGAKGHTIAPRRTGRLGGPAGGSSWDATGRKRSADFFSAGPVEHPGMAARPILPQAFARGQAAAMDAFASVVFGAPGAGPAE